MSVWNTAPASAVAWLLRFVSEQTSAKTVALRSQTGSLTASPGMVAMPQILLPQSTNMASQCSPVSAPALTQTAVTLSIGLPNLTRRNK